MLECKLNKAIEKGCTEDKLRDIQLEISALQPAAEKKLITTDVTAEIICQN